MPYFVTPGTASTVYQERTITNQPVNLALCTQLLPSMVKWHGDETGIPSLLFVGCDAEWAYPDAATRDAELARLAAIQTAGG